jgi:hypothetical protein
MMKRSFGQFNPDRGEGLLRPVSFPQMALMDVTTGDGRELASSGGGVRGLPRTIFAQWEQEPDHLGSVPVGTLQEVTLHDDGSITGRGWLADLPHVRDYFVPAISSKTLFHNSVDLAEVVYEIIWKSDDPADGEDYWTIDKILFTQWKIAATTIVGVPAFADARITLDEVTAALVESDSELEWCLDPTKVEYRLEQADEITASLVADIDEKVSWDDFHMPEPNEPTPHTVTADERVFGHLSEWNKCHEGMPGCVLTPRARSYDKFNYGAGTVLTDKGKVHTGVLFFLGGHPDAPLQPGQEHKAYGGVENAWANIVVSDGRFGPWYCGRVIPGLSEHALHVARSTGVSGHWKRGELQCVVSVNVRGYHVMPGTEIRADHGGASFDDDGVVDLVAGLRLPLKSPERMRDEVAADVSAKLNTSMTMDPNTSTYIGEPPAQSIVWDAAKFGEIRIGQDPNTVAMAVEVEQYKLKIGEPDLRLLELELTLDELDADDPH